jgi:hypothetical protein
MYDAQRGTGTSVEGTSNAPVRGPVALALLLCCSQLRTLAEMPIDWLGGANRIQNLAHWTQFCA